MLTTQKSTIDGVRDEIVRLMELQRENLAELLKSPALFDSTEANKFSSDLDNEIAKVQKLELVVAVVGTMNAGKSTTINAIVGTEVLPNRREAMTTLPTAIRHKAGQTEAQLTFTHNEPFKQLIKELAGTTYRPQLEKLCKPDKGTPVQSMPQDVKILADAFLEGKVTPLKTHYVGRNAIYDFLHRLNDLVRLADLVKVTKSPLDAYTQFDHFPLIEVEFSHLKSIQGYGGGKFTLLDTPGPNEATRSEALGKVLKEQLSKASVILAVIDYTQYGTNADKELRGFLGDVIKEKANRFYVVINKVDERGHNDSKDRGELCKQLAGQFAYPDKGEVITPQVFAVSSLRAHYANAALRELAAPNGALPLEEEWVKKFRELAFGEDADDRLPNPEAESKAAEKMFEKSSFRDLIKPVIQDGYRLAPFTAMYAAIAKIKTQDQSITNFLGLRISAIGKSTNELKKLLDRLQAAVKTLQNAETALKAKAKDVGQKLEGTVRNNRKKTTETVKEKLKGFFTTGRKITIETNLEIQKEMKINEYGMHKWIKGKLVYIEGNKGTYEHNHNSQKQSKPMFDPENKKIIFTNEEKAIDFAKNIRGKISEITKQSEDDTENEFSTALSVLTEAMRREVTENYLNPIAVSVENQVKKGLGFDLKIDLSHAPLARFDLLNETHIDKEMVKTETETKTETKKIEQSGAWGWFKRKVDFFDNDWGIDEKNFINEIKIFVVDLMLIQDLVNNDLEKSLQNFLGYMNKYINENVIKEINKALKPLEDELNRYQSALLQSIEDQNKTQQEKINTQKALEHLAQIHKKNTTDTLMTNDELTVVEQSANLA